MSAVQLESARPIVTEEISDATDTTTCDACEGRHEGCPECHRGRVSGYREIGERRDSRGEWYLAFEPIPCTPAQRAAVDAYLASDQLCPLCDRRVPTTSALPICGSCQATARVAGEQANEAIRQERERVA